MYTSRCLLRNDTLTGNSNGRNSSWLRAHDTSAPGWLVFYKFVIDDLGYLRGLTTGKRRRWPYRAEKYQKDSNTYQPVSPTIITTLCARTIFEICCACCIAGNFRRFSSTAEYFGLDRIASRLPFRASASSRVQALAASRHVLRVVLRAGLGLACFVIGMSRLKRRDDKDASGGGFWMMP